MTYFAHTLNRSFITSAASTLALITAPALVGCTSEAPAPQPDTSPLYALSTILFSPDLSSRQEVLAFSSSLAADGAIDDSKSIEFPTANPSLWPSTKQGEFFIADSSNGDVLKFGLADDGSVVEVDSLGFSAYGVTQYNWALLIAHSATEGFLFDEITLKGFTFNPTEMTITKDFDLSGIFKVDEGAIKYSVWRERAPIKIGNKYFAAYKYFDPSSFATLSRSGMLIIDAEAGTFSAVETTQCGGLFHSVLGKDGLIYSATGVVAAAGYFLGQATATEPCMVRFDPAKMAFDDTYNIALADVVGDGKFVGAIVAPDQKEGPVYMRVLQEAAAPTTVNPLQLAAAPLWDTYSIDDLSKPTTATKLDLQAGGGVPYPFYVDGKTYISGVNLKAPGNQSWFVDISASPPVQNLEMPGWGYFAVRVR